MGREGEVVAELLPEFERAHPGIRVEVQQLPWTAAHEKLLTAFAGDATPDVCQLGNTWIPEFVALGALEPLDAHVAALVGRSIPPTTSPASGTPTGRRASSTASRGTSTRACCSTAATCSRKPASRRRRARGPEWTRTLAALKRATGRRTATAILLPVNEFEPLVALALQQDEPLLRDGGRWGNFQSAGFRARAAFYVECSGSGCAPPLPTAEISNVWNEFGRGYFSFYVSGPWNIGEFKRRLPPERQESWMTAPLPGPNGPGASIAGGSSLVLFRASRNKAAAWQLDRVSLAARRAAALPRAHRRPAAAAQRVGEGALADDVHARAFREQLERVKPTPKVPEWERIANEMRLVAERAVHGELTVDQAAARARRARRSHPRKAPLDARARRRAG